MFRRRSALTLRAATCKRGRKFAHGASLAERRVKPSPKMGASYSSALYQAVCLISSPHGHTSLPENIRSKFMPVHLQVFRRAQVHSIKLFVHPTRLIMNALGQKGTGQNGGPACGGVWACKCQKRAFCSLLTFLPRPRCPGVLSGNFVISPYLPASFCRRAAVVSSPARLKRPTRMRVVGSPRRRVVVCSLQVRKSFTPMARSTAYASSE